VLWNGGSSILLCQYRHSEQNYEKIVWTYNVLNCVKYRPLFARTHHSKERSDRRQDIRPIGGNSKWNRA
jgi:hypothetical protein